MSVSAQEAQEIALRWVDRLCLAAESVGGLIATADGVGLCVVEAASQGVTVAAVESLLAGHGNPCVGRSPRWRKVPRVAVRSVVQQTYKLWTSYSRLRLALSAPRRELRGRALLLPTQVSHFLESIPVAAAIREGGGQPLIGLLDRMKIGRNVYDPLPWTYLRSAEATWGSRRWWWGNHRRLEVGIARAIREASSCMLELSGDEVERLGQASLGAIRAALPDLVSLVWAASCSLKRLTPSCIVVGNPNVMEGRVFCRVAAQLSILSAAIQHGSIFPLHWRRCPADQVFAWGPIGRKELVEAGFPSDKVRIGGSPKHDAVFRIMDSAFQHGNSEKAVVLVATSGPGDGIVSVQDHQRFIRALREAVDATVGVTWKIKLHPKDREDYYSGLRKRKNVVIVAHRNQSNTPSIFPLLEECAALVTVSSTAAIDAMAFRRPVITVDLPGFELDQSPLEFLRRGCTKMVKSGRELAEAVLDVLEGRSWRGVEIQANQYVREQFSFRGTAARCIAQQLVDGDCASRK